MAALMDSMESPLLAHGIEPTPLSISKEDPRVH